MGFAGWRGHLGARWNRQSGQPERTDDLAFPRFHSQPFQTAHFSGHQAEVINFALL